MEPKKGKKRKGRVRQTRTSWQKAFDAYPGMIQPFSWSDRMPEVLHISIALIDHDYQTVKNDFYLICEFVNKRLGKPRFFHFNLSHTIKIIKKDKSILDEIFKTCFKDAFENILAFYIGIFNIEIDFKFKPNPKLLFLGYRQILDGRADISILSKYLMLQYRQQGEHDVFNMFNWNRKEEILEPMCVSTVMSTFSVAIGHSGNLDVMFCQDIWMYNYSNSPLMPKPDDSKEEEKRFTEMQVDEHVKEFKQLYSEFKELNLLAVYPTFIAEINMGFIARIANLSLDTVELVRTHKGEIAEMVFRTTLETFIVASWLLKRKDVELHKRFRDFSTGRTKYFGEQLIQNEGANDKIKASAKKMIDNTIKAAGVGEINVATERGDIFDLRIDQMAEEVWGKDNEYYFLYKRSSEVIHGHWRVIAKYHLAKSLNPMHNGLYWYNENQNHFAGVVPAYGTLGLAIDILLSVLHDIKSEQTKELKTKLSKFRKKHWEDWMKYFNSYIVPTENDTTEK